MDYTLRSGKVVTDEQIEAMAEAIEAGSLPGQWSGEVVVGRPRLADEPLDVISFKVPHSAALAIKRAAEQEGARPSCARRRWTEPKASWPPARAGEYGGGADRIAAIAADPVPLGTNDASPICEARSN